MKTKDLSWVEMNRYNNKEYKIIINYDTKSFSSPNWCALIYHNDEHIAGGKSKISSEKAIRNAISNLLK